MFSTAVLNFYTVPEALYGNMLNDKKRVKGRLFTELQGEA